ncbi:hypothetical protein N5P37_005225 [Trichoderma harzianum]|nr:hypothetical protein N5P37_005225 [Trichoderma harzianum]
MALQCLQAQAQAPCRLVSFVCFVRLASRSTSQPSRNPRGPVTRVWDRPMYTLAPQKRPMGLSVGAPCTPLGPVCSFFESTIQYKQSPCPAHASVLDMLLPSTRMLYRTLPITLVPGPCHLVSRLPLVVDSRLRCRAIRLRCLVSLHPTYIHIHIHSHNPISYHSHPAVSFRDRFPCLVSYSYFGPCLFFHLSYSFLLALLVL